MCIVSYQVVWLDEQLQDRCLPAAYKTYDVQSTSKCLRSNRDRGGEGIAQSTEEHIHGVIHKVCVVKVVRDPKKDKILLFYSHFGMLA